MAQFSNRRDFLRLTGAGLLVAPALLSAREPVKPSSFGKAVRIIFMVSDGMSLGVPSMAEPFSQRVRGRGTRLWQMISDRNVTKGFFDTSSLSSLVTDSAAASTAWGSGSRVINGSINTLPDGTKMTPLLPIAKDAGYATGLVTTTRVTHATPAGFAACQSGRDNEDEVAPQYLDIADVVMGGGSKQFDKGHRDDGEDLYAAYAASGYEVWKNRDEMLRGTEKGRILGTFWDSHLPYTIDHLANEKMAARVPTLAEMTKAALDVLNRNPKGFLLQIEGGRVDHAAHGNDAAAMLHDQLAFDDAIATVLEFVEKNPDTLVVVTSDHGNSNPGLNGMGDAYRESTTCFDTLAKSKGSYDVLSEKLGRNPDPEKVMSAVQEVMQLRLTDTEAAKVSDAASGRSVEEMNSQHRRFGGILAQALGNHTGIGWTGVSHTQDMTMIAAVGPERDAFSGVVRNTEAFNVISGLMGLTHKNPSADGNVQASVVAERRLADWA